MNLLSILMNAMGSQSSVNSLSQQTGVSSGKLKKLLPLLIPILLKYLTNNASNNSGALSLLSALTQHKSRSTFAEQIDEVDQEDGAAIIRHILGDDQEKVVKELARETDMKNEEVEKSLFSIAPVLLSALSSATENAQSSQSAGGPDFLSLLTQFGGTQEPEPEPEPVQQSGGLFNSLFGGLFSNLFGGVQQQAQEEELHQLDTTEEDTSGFDGTSLLSTLLSLMQ